MSHIDDAHTYALEGDVRLTNLLPHLAELRSKLHASAPEIMRQVEQKIKTRNNKRRRNRKRAISIRAKEQRLFR